MRMLGVALLAVMVLSGSTSAGVELAKIDRSIDNEPDYAGDSPRYCLLVFGPEAGHRVWLVQDGDTLYVDRDADGDLTDPGERVTADAEHSHPEDGSYFFVVDELKEGELTHKRLRLWVERRADADSFEIDLQVRMPGRRGVQLDGRVYQRTASGIGGDGHLRFAETPAGAPVVHFRGPWQVTFFGEPPTLAVNRTTEVMLGLVTPGHGPGTTVWTGYEGLIPEGAKPRLEVTFFNKPGPVRELYELPHRC